MYERRLKIHISVLTGLIVSTVFLGASTDSSKTNLKEPDLKEVGADKKNSPTLELQEKRSSHSEEEKSKIREAKILNQQARELLG